MQGAKSNASVNLTLEPNANANERQIKHEHQIQHQHQIHLRLHLLFLHGSAGNGETERTTDRITPHVNSRVVNLARLLCRQDSV